MKVAAVQHDVVWEDAPATLAHLEPLVGEAAAAGARLVVLAEMFSTGFSLTAGAVEGADGPGAAFLTGRAAAEGVWVCGSLAVRPPDAQPVNRFLLAGPDGTVLAYDKRHPFTHAGEDRLFAAGSERATFKVDGLAVTPFVCYDLRFADDFWAAAAATDCYVVVANWPAVRRRHWTTLLGARAIENQAYVVGVNRVGEGGGITYAGDSRVVDPSGEVLVAASGIETVLLADVDPAVVAAVRARYRFLEDRR